jgi:hypothetical protein
MRGNSLTSNESNVRKVGMYCACLLMNLCNQNHENCVELISLNGLELLVNFIQMSNQKLIVYCLECIKICCKNVEEAKVP